MSSYRPNLIRKRRSDDESSESDDDFPPPVKKQRPCNGETNLKKILHSKYQDCVSWMSKLPVNRYFRMSLLRQESVEILDIVAENNPDVVEIEDDEEEEITAIDSDLGPDLSREQRYSDKRGQKSFLQGGGSKGFPKPRLASTPFFTDGTLVGLAGIPVKKANGFQAKKPKQISSRRPNRVIDHTKKPLSHPELDVEIILGSKQAEDSDDLKIIAETSRRNRPCSAFSRENESVPVFDVPSDSFSDQRMNLTSPNSSKYFSAGTCHEVVRLQEKATYKLLLDELLFKSQYRPVKTKETTAIQVDLTQDEDEETVMKCHYSKEILRKPIEDYVEKYHKPCQLVKKTALKSENNEDKKPEMIASALPHYRFKPKEKVNSALFSDEWIKEMRCSVNEETQRRMRLVAQQEDMQKRFRDRREAKLQEDKRLFEKFKVPGDVFPDPSGGQDDFPELTPDMEDMVSAALQKYTGSATDEMSTFKGLTVTRRMMLTLHEGTWLMDEVLNFFLDLVVERSKLDNYPTCYAFTTFFYTSIQRTGIHTVLRWTRKVDIFAHDILFVPLHLGMHWALCCVDNRKKTVCYYDSMGTGGDNSLYIIQNYLVAEMKSKKKIDMDPDEYTLEVVKDLPQQMNGSDCGMFTLRYAEYVSRDAPITFKQAHMNYFRRRTVYEILTKQLM